LIQLENPKNQTLEETTKLEQELNMWLEGARYYAQSRLSCSVEILGSSLQKAQECAGKLGKDISGIVQQTYETAIQNAIEGAEMCKRINPHNARMYLKEAKGYAQKANINIAARIRDLEAELEPKKPKTELIQESEIPLEGLTIIPFEEYQKLGGQMSRTQYEQVKRVRTTQDLCQQALRESREVGGAYVDALQMELLARIIAVVPNMSNFDRVCEMFLLQGKK